MKRTSWWTREFPDRWSRVKAAMHRDWLQTQLHFGASHCFDLRQGFRNTVLQAMGRQSIPVGPNLKKDERANRFGIAARHHYHDIFPDWCQELEAELRHHWGPDFDRNLEVIKLAWKSQMPQSRQQADKVAQRRVVKHGVHFDPADSGR